MNTVQNNFQKILFTLTQDCKKPMTLKAISECAAVPLDFLEREITGANVTNPHPVGGTPRKYGNVGYRKWAYEQVSRFYNHHHAEAHPSIYNNFGHAR